MCRQRVPQTNVYYYKSPEHNDNYVLSFAFAFDKDGEKYQFSLSFPYNYSRCQVLTTYNNLQVKYIRCNFHNSRNFWSNLLKKKLTFCPEKPSLKPL